MKDLGIIQTITKPLELDNVKVFNLDKSLEIGNLKEIIESSITGKILSTNMLEYESLTLYEKQQ